MFLSPLVGLSLADLTPSVHSDCVTLGTCVPGLTEYVNQATQKVVNFTTTNYTSSKATLNNINMTSTMSFTINQCAATLQTQLNAFKEFETSNSVVWTDVSSAQTSLIAVEEAANSILETQSNFTIQLSQIAALFHNTTERATELSQWVTGEKVVRNQLTDLYTELDEKILTTSNEIVVTTSTIRDALLNMQKVHDHATKILTAVGDAETKMYEWAFNVSQKVNQHTVNLVSIAQTLQYRTNQATAIKTDNINLNWVVSQLEAKYGTAKLAELGALYDAGNLEVPSSQAQGLNATSITNKTATNTITG